MRVSLQPTFSPTPPALYDEEGEGEGYAPWSGEGNGTRGKGKGKGKGQGQGQGQSKTGGKDKGDVWADSSEEDEAYSRARRLLSMTKS